MRTCTYVEKLDDDDADGADDDEYDDDDDCGAMTDDSHGNDKGSRSMSIVETITD